MRLATRLTVIVMLLAACGGKAVFQLSADDNDPRALGAALARRQLPARPSPASASGQPRVYAVVDNKARMIVAYDLASAAPVWQAAADVRSRIAVGGDFIVALEGQELVARDQARGAIRWRSRLGGTLIGHAADRERAYAVVQRGSSYWLAGLAGTTGDELWKSAAAGKLGAPAAHGGVVLVPFLSQWLSLVDGKTGEQLTRIRGVGEEIAMLRVTSQVAYFGSKQGVFQLDERSASGKRTDATYGTATVPPQLERTSYGRDVYDPIQTGYSAFDRARVLWPGTPQTTSGPLKWPNDRYAVHYFRYVFGFVPDGTIAWAYSHPRVELVAAEHTGGAIVGVSATGEVVALDPANGAVRARGSLGAVGSIVGATVDADGWVPSGAPEQADTLAALVAIVRDRDARFERVKELAVRALAKRAEPGVMAELLAVLADPRASAQLKNVVVELVIARREPESLAVLVTQLGVHADYIAQTEPANLGVVAKAIAGLPMRGWWEHQNAALAALRRHLEAPTTPVADLAHIIAAMAAVGHDGSELPALGSHLLLYHADDEVAGDPAWQKAIVAALVRGGPRERQLLRTVAEDARTRPGLAAAIAATRSSP